MAGDLNPSQAGEDRTGSAAIGQLDKVETGATTRARGMAEAPERAREMLAMFSQFGPSPSPLEDKLTADHISKMLEIDQVRVGNDRAAEREDRYFRVITFVILCVFLLALVYMLLAAGNDQLTEKVLIGLVTLVAGAAGGYGVGKSQRG